MSDWKQRLTLLLQSADRALVADVPCMTEAELFGLYLFLSRLLG
jgi:hypothetical protein